MSASKFRASVVFNGRNITPDKETGIGAWTDEQIATAITTGKRPDGRQLAPIMNYASFTYLTKEDVAAIVAYLRSIPPVKNKCPGRSSQAKRCRSSRSGFCRRARRLRPAPK